VPKKQGPARDAGGRFVKGESGNPKGKAAGTPNRRTAEIREALEKLTPVVVRKLYELLQVGDPTALKILSDRTLPRRRLLRIDLPVVRGLSDIARAQAAIGDLVANGELSHDEGADLAAMLDRHGSALERADLEKRIAELEARLGDGSK
jgi:hypothetical protein